MTHSKFAEKEAVQVLRNVGSMGPCWLDAVYVQPKGNRHLVRTTGGDSVEQLTVDNDCIRSR